MKLASFLNPTGRIFSRQPGTSRSALAGRNFLHFGHRLRYCHLGPDLGSSARVETGCPASKVLLALIKWAREASDLRSKEHKENFTWQPEATLTEVDARHLVTRIMLEEQKQVRKGGFFRSKGRGAGPSQREEHPHQQRIMGGVVR